MIGLLFRSNSICLAVLVGVNILYCIAVKLILSLVGMVVNFSLNSDVYIYSDYQSMKSV